VKRLLQRVAGALGLTVEPTWRMPRYAQREYLKQLFDALQVDCVFDVGANRGQYHDFLRTEVGYRGTIVSFEANPALHAALRERAARESNWRIEAIALGRTPGRARFNVMAGDQFSSFLAPDHRMTGRFEGPNRVSEEVEVEVRTLAELAPGILQEVAARRPYLKLDTQGFDLEILAGAGAELSRFPALQVEASVTPIYKGGPDYVSLIGALNDAGFALSGIFPNNPGHFPQMVEFDCHMIARTELTARGLLATAGASPPP